MPFTAVLKPEHDGHPKVTPGDKPFHEYRRPPPALATVMQQWVLDSVKAGILKPHRSAYSSPLFMILKPPKADANRWIDPDQPKKYRTLCDLRACNHALVEEKFPQPSCQEIFEKISPDMKIYSGLDLCSAFYQVQTAPDVWDYLSARMPRAFKTSTLCAVMRRVRGAAAFAAFCRFFVEEGVTHEKRSNFSGSRPLCEADTTVSNMYPSCPLVQFYRVQFSIPSGHKPRGSTFWADL